MLSFCQPWISNRLFFKTDALATSSLPEECPSDSGKEITSMSTVSDQQVETPCSSSASDLHLSGLCCFLVGV